MRRLNAAAARASQHLTVITLVSLFLAALTISAPSAREEDGSRLDRLRAERGEDVEAAARPLDPGTLCQDPRLAGLTLEPFSEGGGCGVLAPVSLQQASGARLSPVAVTQCELAQRLADWLEREVDPAAQAIFGERVVGITHYSAYVCRRRNSDPRAPLSLHALGLAIDVAAFQLESGKEVSVLEDWGGEGPGGPAARPFLRRIWRAACGPFGTVLGPESDAQHKNHFHLDVGPRRAPYCR